MDKYQQLGAVSLRMQYFKKIGELEVNKLRWTVFAIGLLRIAHPWIQLGRHFWLCVQKPPKQLN